MPSSTAFGDLNGDTLLDMVVTGDDLNHETGLLSVFMNSPDGYTRRQDFDTGGSPNSAGIADLDGDGDLDVAVANEGGHSGVSVLLNQGAGVLANPVNYASPSLYSPSLALSDLNGDHKPDMAVAGWLNATLEVRLNDGHGGFGTRTSYNSPQVPWAPVAVAAGDVDGDGDADLVAIDDRAGRVSVFENAGDGTFAAPVHYNAGYDPIAIALGDLDGDGELDIALASAGGHGLDVLLNQGNGAFGAHHIYEILSYVLNPSSIALADVNGDGRLDAALATNNGMGFAAIFLNEGDGTFVLDLATDLTGRAASTNLRDATGDGIDDLVVGVWWETDFSNASITVFPGLKGSGYSTPVEFPTSDSLCNSLEGGDFDGDGNFDMATACNEGQGYINVWYGNGGASYTRVDHLFGWVHMSLAAGDLNGDGRTDLIDQVGGSTNNDVAVLLAQPGRKFTSTSYPASDSGDDAGNATAAIGDLDGDGDLDFVVGNLGVRTIRVFFNAGDGSFPAHVDYPITQVAGRLAIGDLDGNGTLDVTFVGSASGVSLFSNDGSGALTYVGDAPTGADPAGIVIADLNGDERNDLVVTNSDGSSYANSTVTVLTNDGQFAFTREDFPVRQDPGALSVGDVDSDGLLDVVVSNSGGAAISVLLNQGNGDYLNRVWPVAEYPGASLIRDLDGDGQPDMAVITYQSGLRVLPQRCW